MNFKHSKAEKTTITRDYEQMIGETDNIYYTINILAKRAKQINVVFKEELNEKLSEFSSSSDNLEEIFENREQVEVSKFYESLPKPPAMAIKEFEEGKIYYRAPEETSN